MFVSNRYFNNKFYFIPWFRVHLKHCSSDHNTSRDLEFDKNVPRLVTTGAINLKKKQSEGNTLLCYEHLFLYKYQVQMLKSFSSLLIQKFSVSAQGTSCQNFFPAHARAWIFWWTMVLCTNFFLTHMHLHDIFFQNHPPPLKKVKWLAPYNRQWKKLGSQISRVLISLWTFRSAHCFQGPSRFPFHFRCGYGFSLHAGDCENFWNRVVLETLSTVDSFQSIGYVIPCKHVKTVPSRNTASL